MADVPVRFAGLRGTLAAFAVDLFAGRVGSLTDAPMCSGGYDRWGIYDGTAWRLGPASDYAGNANILSLNINGTQVIDSSRNVKGATVYTGGAIRIDGNGDITGRNQSLTGWLALNGAARPAWAVPAAMLDSVTAIWQIGGCARLGRNVYYDGSAFKAISTLGGSDYAQFIGLGTDGALSGYASQTPAVAGATLSDMLVRWQFNRFGGLGLFGVTPPTSRPNITGSRGGSAETALLTALAATGIIQDSTTLKGASFACMYRVAAGAAQSIPSGATYTKVTPFDTNMGGNVNSTPDQANNQIIAGRDGTYQVDWTRTYTVGSVNVQWHVAIFVDGVVQPQAVMQTKSGSTATSTYACLAVQVQALAGQAIDVRVYHDQGSSVNLTYEHATLSITAIDAGT